MKAIFKNDRDVTIELRYLPVVVFLDKEKESHDSILEIGSGSFGICPYLKKDNSVTGVDVVFNKEVHPLLEPVVGSASKLPFKDGSFDFVISMDMLEHLSSNNRELAVKQMLRVARKAIVLGFPSGPFSHLADRFLDWYYKRTHKIKSNFLAEHLAVSLPRAKEVTEMMRKELVARNKEGKFRTKNNTNIFLLVSLLLLGFSQNKYLCRLFRYLVIFVPVFRFLNFPPAYRKIIFVKIKQ